MNVRTISQLPEISTDFDNGLFEVSVPNDVNDSRRHSRSIKYSTMKDNMLSAATDKLVNEYGLEIDDQPVSVSSIAEDVNQLCGEDVTLSGVKKFDDWPVVQKDEFPDSFENYGGNGGDYVIPNTKKVNEMMLNTPVYISTTSSMVAEGNPFPKNYASMNYGETVGSGKFYYWQIDDGQTDSSFAVKDEKSGSMDSYEEIRDTGVLVMWGWLADNGSVEAQNAWIGLFTQMKTEGNDTVQTDIPIAIQPWIRGTNASQMQYVGFTIPVRKGLRVKVKTGFPVNGRTALNNVTGSLMFLDQNVPNSFFGYVIK